MMKKIILMIELLIVTIIAASLTGCLATAAAVGVAGGAYYEKNKSDKD